MKNLKPFILAAVCAFGAAPAIGSDVPNVTGSWRLNVEKSKFGYPAPKSFEVQVEHREPFLKMRTTVNWANGRKETSLFDGAIDGKPYPATEGAATWRRLGMREVESTMAYSNGATAKLHLTLSENGRVLIVKRETQTPDGVFTSEEIWEKQPDGDSKASAAVHPASSESVIQRLAGVWKEDPSKRKTGTGPNLRFRRSANGGIEELRGPEIKPEVQAVILDGRPHPVPGATYSIAWRQIDANYYQRETFGEAQRLLHTRHLRLAPDGKTLTVEGVRAIDGLRSVSVYRRIDGAPHGLTGTWARESTQGQPAAEMTIEHARANAIRFLPFHC